VNVQQILLQFTLGKQNRQEKELKKPPKSAVYRAAQSRGPFCLIILFSLGKHTRRRLAGFMRAFFAVVFYTNSAVLLCCKMFAVKTQYFVFLRC